AITLINLASCEEKTGKLADALGHWVDARARAQAEGNNAIVDEAEKKAKALEPRLPKLTLALASPSQAADVEVVRDGVTLGRTAIAGIAVRAITGELALSKARTAKTDRPNVNDCSAGGMDAVESGRRLGRISTIGFIRGGVGAAVGVYGLVWGKPQGSASVAV